MSSMVRDRFQLKGRGGPAGSSDAVSDRNAGAVVGVLKTAIRQMNSFLLLMLTIIVRDLDICVGTIQIWSRTLDKAVS